jgi:hypothetical protein
LLVEIREYDADPRSFRNHDAIPATSPWWKHDAAGKQIRNPEYPQFDLLETSNPEFQDHVAAQARAVLASGVVDGIMLDWWKDDATHLALLKKIRSAIGPDAIVIINTNERRMSEEMSALVNGYYMECWKTKNFPSEADVQKEDQKGLKAIKEEWKQIQDALEYAEKYTREPHTNMVETWWELGSKLKRQELDKMRATTTLVMTLSDGYSLFADPDNNGVTPDHSHEWYGFYFAVSTIGKPLGPGIVRADGSSVREFEHGTAFCNLTPTATSISFEKPMMRASKIDNAKYKPGEVLPPGTKIEIAPYDGDVFLTAP